MDIQTLRQQAIREVREKLRNSVSDDLLIVQAVSNIEDLEKVVNLTSKRLREWYELYNPEISNAVDNHEKFVSLILSKTKKELLKEINVDDTMGAEFTKENLDAVMNLAKQIKELFQLKHQQEEYLETMMEKTCPNVKEVAGTLIGAKLISLAGSLIKLSKFPASTVQLLGAEKALFRHLKNRRNLPPKFGILHEHAFIGKVAPRNKGKMARTLADKISIASKVDYFKGKFVGKELFKQVEKKATELSKR